MPARRFMMLVKESSYGVPMEDPVPGVDSFYLRMGDGTDIQDDPIIQEIAHGGGRTTTACAWSDQRTHTGTISTLLYPGQAEFLLKWWLVNINPGRTLPWPTTDPLEKSPLGDLASVSVYDAIQDMSGAYKRLAHRGAKVGAGTLNFAGEGENRAGRLTLNIQAADIEEVNATEFPAPASDDYPCGPYVFSDMGGKLVIGQSRPFFDDFAFSSDNQLQPRYWSGARTPYLVNTFGRNTTLGVWLPRKSNPDDFGAFSDVDPLEASFEINDGERWVKVDLLGNNHWQSLAKQLPDGSLYGWAGVLKNKWDSSDGVDADLVVTSGVVEEEEP